MSKPRYFVAVFGDPVPGRDAVDSGVYAPDSKYAPFQTRAGDVMLLYCTAGYPGHASQVPGVGVVLLVNGEHIEYRWIPLLNQFPRPTLIRISILTMPRS